MVFHLLLEAWQGWFVVFAQKNIKVKARRNHDFSAAVACSFYLMTGKNQMKLTARLVFERMCWFSAMCVVQGKVARGMVFLNCTAGWGVRGYGLLLLLVHFLWQKNEVQFCCYYCFPMTEKLPEFCCLVHGMVLVIFELHSKVWFWAIAKVFPLLQDVVTVQIKVWKHGWMVALYFSSKIQVSKHGHMYYWSMAALQGLKSGRRMIKNAA